MIPSVGAVAIGHFSIDGTLKKDHFNRGLGNCVPNMFIIDETTDEVPPVELMSQLVEVLTYPGQTVVDTTYNGIITITVCVYLSPRDQHGLAPIPR